MPAFARALVRVCSLSSLQALGNNIYPAISGLSEVMRGPTVRGAVTSVCGPNYSTSPHRFMHERLRVVGLRPSRRGGIVVPGRCNWLRHAADDEFKHVPRPVEPLGHLAVERVIVNDAHGPGRASAW